MCNVLQPSDPAYGDPLFELFRVDNAFVVRVNMYWARCGLLKNQPCVISIAIRVVVMKSQVSANVLDNVFLVENIRHAQASADGPT